MEFFFDIMKCNKRINVSIYLDILTIPEAKERQIVSSLPRQELEDRYLRLREESVVGRRNNLNKLFEYPLVCSLVTFMSSNVYIIISI